MSKNGISLESIYKGSKYSGAIISVQEIVEGVEQHSDLTGADVLMQLKRNDTVYKTYKTSDSTLQIVDGDIVIPAHVPELESGIYDFDFSIIMPNTDPFNGVAPGTWEILEPKSKR